MALALALWTALGISAAPTADPPVPKSADDALTCEQVYAQVTAETKREQQERAQKSDAMKSEAQASKALLTGAFLAGGLGGTAQAANHAVAAGAERQVALGAAPPSNPRKDHLKQLWAQKRCVMK